MSTSSRVTSLTDFFNTAATSSDVTSLPIALSPGSTFSLNIGSPIPNGSTEVVDKLMSVPVGISAGPVSSVTGCSPTFVSLRDSALAFRYVLYTSGVIAIRSLSDNAASSSPLIAKISLPLSEFNFACEGFTSPVVSKSTLSASSPGSTVLIGKVPPLSK